MCFKYIYFLFGEGSKHTKVQQTFVHILILGQDLDAISGNYLFFIQGIIYFFIQGRKQTHKTSTNFCEGFVTIETRRNP